MTELSAPPPQPGNLPGRGLARGPGDPVSPGPGALVVRGLDRTFGDKVALHPLDLDIAPGGVIGLLGPNGSGKSTLMRLLVGLVPRQNGGANVDGEELRGDGLAIRRRTTYAPGELHLYGELKGSDQLDVLLRGRDRATRTRAKELARKLGLPLERRVRGYSHGMKRQLVFSAAMAPDVRVRILDEISEGLDPAKRSVILERIEADAAAGTTILLSSHHLGEVDRSCQRLLFLNAGKLIADETADDVRRRASRLMRVTFAPGTPGPLLRNALAGPHIDTLRIDDEREGGMLASILLSEDDPRPFLTSLAGATELPAPRSIEHGRLSLRELYRSLYGVEGT